MDEATSSAMIAFADAVDRSFGALARSIELLSRSLDLERERFDQEMSELRDDLIDLDHKIAGVAQRVPPLVPERDPFSRRAT
jgi:primase-polymerase (primpol)-like protein